MLKRFTIFVDGSNLIGSVKRLGVQIPEYQEFYRHVFDEAVAVWKLSLHNQASLHAQLTRVHWYQVGSIDEIDLAEPKFQAHLKEQFDADRDLKKVYMALAGQKLSGQSQDKVALEAWRQCFDECSTWYQGRRELLAGMRRFNFSIRSNTDFIDIVECGHWKVHFLSRFLEEKGLDTTLAVDMVTLSEHYDVALLLSGDADTIPSVNHLKRAGRHVGVIDLIKGYPPEKKGRQFSSKLQSAVDFVVPIYEMNLMQKRIAVQYGGPPDVPTRR